MLFSRFDHHPASHRLREPVEHANAFTATSRRAWLSGRTAGRVEAAIQSGGRLGPQLAEELVEALHAWGRDGGAERVSLWSQGLVRGGVDVQRELTSADLTGELQPAGRVYWDASLAPFIVTQPDGPMVRVPVVRASADGEALDGKLPLLRSVSALAAASGDALALLGHEDPGYVLPVVRLARTFVLRDEPQPGLAPGSPQAIEECVQACLENVERELAGIEVVAALTRHGDRHTLELTPAPAAVAGDRLQIALDVLTAGARLHGLECLVEPVARDTWSLWAVDGTNLLDTTDPLRFWLFRSALQTALDTHGDLLRALACGGFALGVQAEAALQQLARHGSPDTTAAALPGDVLEAGALTPLALTILHTSIAGALTDLTRSLRPWLAAGEEREPAVHEVVAHAARGHLQRSIDPARPIDATVAPEVFNSLLSEPAVVLFAEHGVLSWRELAARRDALIDDYAATLEGAADAAVRAVHTLVLPAVLRRRAQLEDPAALGRLDRVLEQLQALARVTNAVVAAAAPAGLARARDLGDDVLPLLADLRVVASHLGLREAVDALREPMMLLARGSRTGR